MPKNPVRASFIRFLALGGDDEVRVHERGVDLENATIEGQLDLDQCKGVLPLLLNGCTLSSNAPILARDAHLSLLSLQGCAVPRGIYADRANVEGIVLLRNGANIIGEIRFVGAKIEGDLDAAGSTLYNADRSALNCDGALIGGKLLLEKNAIITGEIRLLGATINGDLSAIGSTLQNTGNNALNCDRAQIGGNVFLNNNAEITGTVRLLGARIEGDFYATESRLSAESTEDGIALNAKQAVMDGKALLSDGLTSHGTIHFAGATVRRDLDLTESTIQRPGGWAVDLQDIRVEGTLRLDSVRDGEDVPGLINGNIDLRGANVAYLSDRISEKKICYFSGFNAIDHFVYERFVGLSTLDVDNRLRWLSRQPSFHRERDFRPQPYEQLAGVYREMGHEDRRHEVLLEKKKRELRSQVGVRANIPSGDDVRAWVRNPLAVLKLLFFELPVGYGHRVGPMFYGFLALFLISFAVFWRASAEGYIVPQDTRMIAYEQMIESCEKPWTRCELDILKDYPEFNSFIYAADVLLPVVGLEQQTAWTPQGWKLNALKWLDILYGWFTGLMLVAIVSGVVQRA